MNNENDIEPQRLPKWFYPDKGRKPLSYHSKMSRWDLEGKYATLNSVGRGQEFILDTEDYSEALRWLKSLFK
ncbi:MAG TPA: hypothetical protein VKO43_03970 [Candidatus Krumholzibacteriaceae bacterium]|nr:hypothetical protein [Candidatus Krumholzibacteriaceae bacterium]